MTADVVTLAVAAIAMATETRTGVSDDGVLDLILDALPDDTSSYRLFIALLRTYQSQYDRHGSEALQRSGLALARCAAGLQS